MILTWKVDISQHDFHVLFQWPNPMMSVKLFLIASDCDDRCISELATVLRSLTTNTLITSMM